MKRLGLWLLLLAVTLCLFIPARAADSAQRVDSTATVHTDRSCTVQLQLRLHLDNGVDELLIPLPGSAGDVLLNQQPAQTREDAGRVLTVLPGLSAGDHTLNLQYTLKNAVDTETGILSLPLLTALPYSISSMEFTVTLPHAITATPKFTSGYHQQLIREKLTIHVSENTLHGYLNAPLKDHETLLLELEVDSSQYFTPKSAASTWFDMWDVAIFVCLFLAGIYFLLTLLPRAPRVSRCCSAPDGISAGEVGTCLTGCGTDLTLLVMTWAQLGYLSIELDNRNRVLLHKRMQMGNERSAIENRWFQQLFGSRTTVNGTGQHYAQLYRKVMTKAPLMPLLFAPGSGKRWIFRGLCCTAGMLSGIRLGLSLDLDGGGRILVTLLLGILTGLGSYLIQSGGKCLPLRNKMPLWTGLICGAGWILLGVLTDHTTFCFCMVALQFIAGTCAAYGGKRSELGKRSMAQVLGLRSHMVNATTFDLQQLMQKNPNYFYELAPYALAMGIDRKFARRFGKELLPEESFLELGRHKQPTAAQWAAQLRRAADLLNRRQRRLPLDRLLGK